MKIRKNLKTEIDEKIQMIKMLNETKNGTIKMKNGLKEKVRKMSEITWMRTR